jgi:uncharacterized linocin/CFP29 family protein
MPGANVDLIGRDGVRGEVAKRFVGNGALNYSKMRPYIKDNGKVYVNVYKGGPIGNKNSWVEREIQTNAGTLRRDEWKLLDEAIMEPGRYRLGGIDDLRSNGLTYTLGNALGTMVLEWHDVGTALSAVMTMDGITRGNNDAVEFQTNYLPIPIIHVDYEINTRELEASRSLGNPLDTTLAQNAARAVNEKLENLLFTDTSYAWGDKDDRNRNKIYSYLNFPDRNLVNISIPWDHSAITPAGILQDVQDLKAAARAAYHYGPYMLYIPTAYERVLENDYDVAGSSMLTIRERIMKLTGIKDIKVIDTLPTDNLLLVQMTPDTVRLVQGMGLQNVQWGVEGDFLTKFKVMTIQVPQIRSDQNGKCGIVHATT